MAQPLNRLVPVGTTNLPLIHPLEEVLIDLNPHLTLSLGKVHLDITNHWTGHSLKQKDPYEPYPYDDLTLPLGKVYWDITTTGQVIPRNRKTSTRSPSDLVRTQDQR